MYTQCPECETTFRLGAEDLRRANGKVRCGDCNTVFNALEYLAEEVVDETNPDPLSRWTSSLHNPHDSLGDGTDDLTPEDLEALAEDDEEEEEQRGGILYIAPDEHDDPAVADGDAAAEPAEGATPTDEFDDDVWDSIPGIGDLPDSDDDDQDWHSEDEPGDAADEWQPETDAGDEDGDACNGADDAADDGLIVTVSTAPDDAADQSPARPGDSDDDLEFNVPAESWQTFFGPLPKGQAAAVWQPPALDDDADDLGDDDDDFAVPDDDADDEFGVGPDADAEDDDSAGDDDDDDEYDYEPYEAADGDEDAVDSELAGINRLPDDFTTATDPTDEALATPGPRFPASHELATPVSNRSGWWTVAMLAGAAFLVGQLLHYNRDALATHPTWGEKVRALYAALDSELYPIWAIEDYEIRASEAVAGESGQDVLDIRAQIAVTGKYPTGLPRLRVVLRDRWSNPVAAQDFAAREYADIAALPATGILQPGDVLNAHVSILDPGSGAQGFELELCLPRRNEGLECSGQPFK